MSAALVTARTRLGQIITWHIDRRGWDARRVANATHASIDVVHDWRAGRMVPTSHQWMLLKGTVARDLNESSQLWREAMAEYEASEKTAKEEKKKIMGNHHSKKNGHDTKLVSLSAKMQSAIMPALAIAPRTSVHEERSAANDDRAVEPEPEQQEPPKQVEPPKRTGGRAHGPPGAYTRTNR